MNSPAEATIARVSAPRRIFFSIKSLCCEEVPAGSLNRFVARRLALYAASASVALSLIASVLVVRALSQNALNPMIRAWMAFNLLLPSSALFFSFKSWKGPLWTCAGAMLAFAVLGAMSIGFASSRGRRSVGRGDRATDLPAFTDQASGFSFGFYGCWPGALASSHSCECSRKGQTGTVYHSWRTAAASGVPPSRGRRRSGQWRCGAAGVRGSVRAADRHLFEVDTSGSSELIASPTAATAFRE